MRIEFKTEDGAKLVGYQHLAEKPKAQIILNPAAAIDISYYEKFVQFLVEQSFNVFTWNYRCFGESKPKSLANMNFSYSDVGLKDMPAALKQAKELGGDLPLLCIGHSIGAQQVGLAYNKELIEGLIAVGSSSGYYPYMPLSYSLKALFFFYFFTPITGPFFKYIPAGKFKIMEDLPLPFAKEWAFWCAQKELLFSSKIYGKIVPEGSYKDFKIPIHIIVADDDEICTPCNVSSFWGNVRTEKEMTNTTFKARDFRHKKLGHFGYFRKSNQAIWLEILMKLNSWLHK